MLYPESQFKVYTGKLISVEMELERIESRLEMSSFIILITAILAVINTVYTIVDTGRYTMSSTLQVIITGLYFLLWIKSYKFPLICFITALAIYSGKLYLNWNGIISDSFSFIAYRLAIPIILIIGILNVFYSWYSIRNIRQKEIENPSDVKKLCYVLKDEFIYDNGEFQSDIVKNADNVEHKNGFSEIILKNSEKYYSYNIVHNFYDKYMQVYVKDPLLSVSSLIDLLFGTKLKSHIYLPIRSGNNL